MVQAYKLGTIIGEESGTRYSDYGNAISFRTKYTKTLISISNKYLSDPSEKKIKRGVIPDIIVRPKIDDIINGVDTQLTYILKNLIH
ncbi:hypothetical protein HLVA_17580 [Haliovirga abyssi]|uniref:Tail specific protease domain-containing protein n=1 Tax=Haliovirga abyssi TaxID=2996794 RepID=A0AAU9DV44_9FUSO|nr:hypothetical protein HLVA_17580 [Haliovirga abyssi]